MNLYRPDGSGLSVMAYLSFILFECAAFNARPEQLPRAEALNIIWAFFRQLQVKGIDSPALVLAGSAAATSLNVAE
jgi:hypothetical protein